MKIATRRSDVICKSVIYKYAFILKIATSHSVKTKVKIFYCKPNFYKINAMAQLIDKERQTENMTEKDKETDREREGVLTKHSHRLAECHGNSVREPSLDRDRQTERKREKKTERN